jgi:hypothetical protein
MADYSLEYNNNVPENSKTTSKGTCQFSSIRLSFWSCRGMLHTSSLMSKPKLKVFSVAWCRESKRGFLSSKSPTTLKWCALPPLLSKWSEKRLLTMWIGRGRCQLEHLLLHSLQRDNLLVVVLGPLEKGMSLWAALVLVSHSATSVERHTLGSSWSDLGYVIGRQTRPLCQAMPHVSRGKSGVTSKQLSA